MRFARSAEQEQFAASLHDMLVAADVPGAARQWASGDQAGGLALWRKLAGAGVTALAVPQRWGGLGASPLDLVVACEELGHHALPGPVAESVAAVPWLIAALAGPAPGDVPAGEAEANGVLAGAALAGQWLPGLAAGDLIATVALPPQLPYAADADAAGMVLLAEADTVWLAEPRARRRSVDPARSLFEVGGRQVLARGPATAAAIARAFEAGVLASAAQLLGAGHALLAASVRHAGQRIQFGRPVGAFQAVKHQLADTAIGLEFARPLLDTAASTLAAHGRDVARDVSAAKVACTDAARRAARSALQVHGAIGYTEEHDLHLWLTKVRALAGSWGSQAEHRARIMDELTADGN
jgi:alkylation response protein AidB-like acyl-CoA dehydrogenase